MNERQTNDLVTRARAFCRKAHEGQTRDNGEDYATHPIAVADILRDRGVEEPNVLAAALLHDVIEDTAITAERLDQEFGSDVAGLVRELTNEGYPGRTREQKQQGLIDEAKRMSDEAKLIKLADRLHNLSQMDVWEHDRKQRYARESLELLEALRPWPLPVLAEAVRRTATAYL
ncbi:MAG: bifunctional (p)ppGpp synthetase/guanosine-3',5'-bis(diphosphate) 3'-pyrophosphohydrolase [Phycisphaerae bacterium]|nr:bifunctional (p)ppGpp synthetase/guanosine-3',5'-bis(diphosphate) 3'-pyrophosphohydrolase [Phycisphaerae bacterium]